MYDCSDGHTSELAKVARKETTFPLCGATESHWKKRNIVSLVSSVTELMRLPISETGSTVTPEVSMATRKKTWVLARALYVFLLAAALSAAAPAVSVVAMQKVRLGVGVGNCDVPAMGFPLAQGSKVVPSGRLPSWRIKLTGSLTAGTWARFIALQIMSLRWLCLWCLGVLRRHYYHHHQQQQQQQQQH